MHREKTPQVKKLLNETKLNNPLSGAIGSEFLQQISSVKPLAMELIDVLREYGASFFENWQGKNGIDALIEANEYPYLEKLLIKENKINFPELRVNHREFLRLAFEAKNPQVILLLVKKQIDDEKNTELNEHILTEISKTLTGSVCLDPKVISLTLEFIHKIEIENLEVIKNLFKQLNDSKPLENEERIIHGIFFKKEPQKFAGTLTIIAVMALKSLAIGLPLWLEPRIVFSNW